MKVFSNIKSRISEGRKMVSILVDPDKFGRVQLDALRRHEKNIDLLLVGGSFTFRQTDQVVETIKLAVDIPVVLFPGDVTQLSARADAMLMLSLISGRNAEFLIGNHVLAAPRILESKLETIPVGYILIDGGKRTAVSYISNTMPIPADQHDIAVATALAGKYLGLQMIYLEAGSGANFPVDPVLVEKVKKAVKIPVVAGGGIRTTQQAVSLLKAGADIIVIGSLFENNPESIESIIECVKSF
jgi:phosphoglycerol geranylgeranyltransferase